MAASLALAATTVLVPVSAVPQELPPVDSLVAADTTEAREPARVFPSLPERRTTATVWECDASCLLENPDLTLVELLVREVPGLVPLRGGYFGGPHHLLDGPFGPGFLRVRVDGRDLAPLEGGQVDLTRIALVGLRHVRVERRAGETVVALSSRRHRDPVAYSRITGGAGSPSLQVLRGIFTNGLGRDFTVGGSVDLFDLREVGRSNDRLEFRGHATWMPGTDRFGIELEYGSQDILRTAVDSVEFGRRELSLRARANLSEAWQVEARLAESRWREDAAVGAGAEEDDGAEDAIVRSVREAAATVRVGFGGVAGEAEIRFVDAAWMPSVSGRVETAWRPLSSLTLEAGAEVGSWEGFSTSELRGGVLVTPRLPIPVRLRADAATGTRGIPRPLEDAADSVAFDALGIGAELELGPYTAFGRLSVQRAGRQLPFGDPFDRELTPGPEVDATTVDAGIEGPILPVGAIVPGLEPIRVAGWWRRQRPDAGTPFYLPENVLHGELILHDSFFDEALELWLVGHVTRRDPTLAPRPGESEPVLLPAYTWAGGHLTFRVGRFRFWYKLLNPAGLVAQELPDLTFPTAINAVGIHWEFVN